MASIIEQIQKDALDQTVSVSTLLRKVKLAAAKLELQKVEGWVDSELKGYGTDGSVPEYRQVRGFPVARGVVGGFEPIAFDAGAAEKFSTVPIGQSIPGIEGQLKTGSTASLIFPYPPALMAALNAVNRRQMVECGVKFSATSLVAIVEAVRTLVLEWSIEMERAGIAGSDLRFSDEEKNRAQAAPISIHIESIGTFTGNLGIGNVASDITSTSSIQVERVANLLSQIKSHSTALAQEGLNEQDILRRVSAIEAELHKPTPDHQIIRSLLTGLRSVVVGAAQGLLTSGLLSLLNQILGTGVPV
jgi:hypothetical protein